MKLLYIDYPSQKAALIEGDSWEEISIEQAELHANQPVEFGRMESVRYIETLQTAASKLGFKEPTYGKAQWKSEVNRHCRHK